MLLQVVTQFLVDIWSTLILGTEYCQRCIGKATGIVSMSHQQMQWHVQNEHEQAEYSQRHGTLYTWNTVYMEHCTYNTAY